MSNVEAGNSMNGHPANMPMQVLEQRYDGLNRADNVCRGCLEAVLRAGKIRVEGVRCS